MYYIMEKKHDKYPVVTKATKQKGAKYTLLNTSSDEKLHISSETKAELNVRDKVATVWKALPFTLTMITGYFSFFFTLQSVVTTLAFPDAPFGPRNHYIFYTLALMTGNLTGRIYALILVTIRSGIEPGTPALGGRDLYHCANPSAMNNRLTSMGILCTLKSIAGFNE